MAAQGVFAMELRRKVVVNTTKSCAPYFKGNGHHAPTWDLRKAQAENRKRWLLRKAGHQGIPSQAQQTSAPREDISDRAS